MRSWITLLTLLLAAVAQAQPDSTLELARRRYETGRTLYKMGKFEDSLIELEAARALMDVPELYYNIGLCLAKLDRPDEAAEALQRFVAARPKDPSARAIRKQIVSLRAVAAKRKAQEQQSLPSPAVVERPPVEPTRTAPEPPAEATPATTPAPAAAAPPPPPSTAPAPPATAAPAAPPPSSIVAEESVPTVEKRWIQTGRGRAAVALASVAAVLLAGAAVTGSLALVDRSSYNEGCDAHFCDHALYERMHGLALGTDVLIGVGAATAITALLVGTIKPRSEW